MGWHIVRRPSLSHQQLAERDRSPAASQRLRGFSLYMLGTTIQSQVKEAILAATRPHLWRVARTHIASCDGGTGWYEFLYPLSYDFGLDNGSYELG